MDEDTAELVAQLCTRAGMIMEDTSATALTIGHREPAAWAAAIQQLDTAAAQTTALVRAAKALMLSQYSPPTK